MKNLINKINNPSKLAIYGLGIATIMIAESATAVNFSNGGTDENAFITNNSLTKIGEVEAVAGGRGKELFFGVNGSGVGTQSSADFTWNNRTQYDWTLTWDTVNNLAQFTVENFNTKLQYDFDNSSLADPTLDKFNAFGLITKANGTGRSPVEDGTKISLDIDTVAFSNGDSISDLSTIGSNSVSSIANSTTQIFDKQFYVLSDAGVEITEITGNFSLDWNNVNPQSVNANSFMGFEFKLFNNPTTSIDDSSSKSTPEPGSIISLFALGTLGLIRSKQKNK